MPVQYTRTDEWTDRAMELKQWDVSGDQSARCVDMARSNRSHNKDIDRPSLSD